MLEHLDNVTARHVNREPFERPSNGFPVNPVPQPTAVARSSAANATSSLATPASRSGIRRKAVASTLRASSRPSLISPPRTIFNPIFPDCPRCESHLPARSVALAPVTAQRVEIRLLRCNPVSACLAVGEPGSCRFGAMPFHPIPASRHRRRCVSATAYCLARTAHRAHAPRRLCPAESPREPVSSVSVKYAA